MALYGLNLKVPKVIITEEAKQLARLAAYARTLKADRKSSSDKLYGAKK